MQLTRTSEKLKRTILFNAALDAYPFSAPVESGYFSLILIKSGVGQVTIRTRDGARASFSVQPPVAICLRDNETLTHELEEAEVYNLVFSPTFININMRPSVLDGETYALLAAEHHLFTLSPFMETHAELKRMDVSMEQMEACFTSCRAISENLEDEDPDNFWSCRIRSHFMDILVGLETLYTHRRQAMGDPSVTFATYRDMVIRINSDLMHPCGIEEVCKSFGINKNKLQRIFRTYAGVSYHDCVSNARRERAQYYLAFTEIRLSEIAYRLGFSSEQHFYRFFRRETGISPHEFRKTSVAQRKEAFAAACFGRPSLIDPVDPGSYPSRS